jgi:hypothetical protein
LLLTFKIIVEFTLECKRTLEITFYIWNILLMFCIKYMCAVIFINLSNYYIPPRALPPYRGDEVCAPQWPGEPCWRERRLLVEPFLPERWKGRCQTKCSPWSSRLGVWLGANDRIPEEFTVRKHPHTHTHTHTHTWRRPRGTQDCSASEE